MASDRAEIEAYIRRAAAARGLDPDFAVRVAKGESGLNPKARLNTAKEDSKGVWQLNTKNGLGVEALKRGIDPGNPETWREQTDFALDQAKQSWRPWTVARNLQAGRATPTKAPAPSADPGLPNVTQLPTTGLLGPAPDPFAAALAEREKEQQAQQQLAQAVEQAKVAPPPPQPAPPEPVPAAPPVDYSSLLMPRLRRGLLADTGYGLLA